MRRLLFFLLVCISCSFTFGFAQQEQFSGAIPESDHALLVQARASYKEFLEEVKLVGTQCKDNQQVDALGHLQPYVEKAQTCLTEVKAHLEDKLVLLPVGNDVRQAYVVATNELGYYHNTLRAFSDLKKSGESIIANTHGLFVMATYAFGIYKNVLELHKQDHKVGFLREHSLDMGLRTALAAWYVFMQKAEKSRAILSEAIQGNVAMGSLSSFPEINLILSAIGVFYNPSPLHQRVRPILQGFGKMASALLYYHVFNGRVFNKDGVGFTKKVENPLVAVAASENYAPLQKDEVFLPNGSVNYEQVRKAIFGALHETQLAVFDELYQHVRMNFHPQMIEKVEKNTMGIVKPELLGEIFETLVPVVFFSKNKFVDSVVPYEDQGFNKRRDLLLNLFTDDKFGKIEKYSKEGNVWANYVEFRVISYLCSSLGRHWGRFFTNKYKDQLGAFASTGTDKTVNLCAKIHLISKEKAEQIKEFKKECGQQFEEFVSSLRSFIKNGFIIGSLERTAIFGFLKLRGDITSTEGVDSLAVTKEMLEFVLMALAELRLVSYLHAAETMQKFDKNPEDINNLVDDIVDTVRANLIAAFGGFIGSKVVPWVARCIMQSHGPFLAKKYA